MAEKYNTLLIGSWDRSVKAWDAKKDRGAEKYWGDHWGHPTALEELIKKYSNNGIGLELGCGSARLLVHFYKYFKHLYGVDTSEAGIEQSVKRLKGIKNVSVSVGDGFTLDGFDDDSLDLIYSQDVFQHFNNSLVYIYLKEFTRVLKTGGVAIVNLRNMLTDFAGFRTVSDKYLEDRPHNFSIWVRYITSELVRLIATDVGLVIAEICQPPSGSPPIFVFEKL